MTAAVAVSERVIRIERPARRYLLLRDAAGYYLHSPDGAGLAATVHVDDSAVWQPTGRPDTLRHVSSGLRLAVTPSGRGLRVRDEVFADAAIRDALADRLFVAARGPDRLPSALQRDFERQGWVCLPALLDAASVDELAGLARERRDRRGRVLPFGRTAAAARAAAEPVSLWLTRRYLRTDDVRVAHPPSIAVLERDDGRRDVQGWHSDYPYLWGSARRVGGDRVPAGGGASALGVQRNVCITAFTRDNGATRFKLGSHRLDTGPPAAWGLDADYDRRGHRLRYGLPYGGPGVDVIEAPPGSILLYDARTWHRAGINTTGEPRAALLQAMTPGYIMPFMDTGEAYRVFADSGLNDRLDDRERNEIARLMLHRIVGPLGSHAIAADAGLTAYLHRALR